MRYPFIVIGVETATQLVQTGVDLPTVKRISGHKTLALVDRYSHQNGFDHELAFIGVEPQ